MTATGCNGMEVRECHEPRCTAPSLFSTVGMVGGHYYASCYPHALAMVQRNAERWNDQLKSLTAARPSVPGQLSLVD